MSFFNSDTICAIATPPGQGGIGIVRISGPACLDIAKSILGFVPTPRHAHYSNFLNASGVPIEQGIALYFSSPNSFTGEDILELQGHGGSQIIQEVLKSTLEAGARLARPGEFSERAFLNGKIDLLQAEAIADLIEASSEQAAKSAMRTLQGVFSARIHAIVAKLISLRVQVEASIDFSDEEIDLESEERIQQDLINTKDQVDNILEGAKQGVLLKTGLSIAIAGKPNAGKSSLLNALAEVERAIVTDIPGTTRDILQEQISIDGLPLNIIDTAGLRESLDVVEKEGVRRAKVAIKSADQLLLVLDTTDISTSIEAATLEVLALLTDDSSFSEMLSHSSVILNKIDLARDNWTSPNSVNIQNISVPVIAISAKNLLGMESLRQHLKECVNYTAAGENSFIARERHLISLRGALKHIEIASERVSDHSHWELLAEELRIAQQELNKITGDFSSDDLLGEIFSNFCVGK
ncbi:MAG: tRNA modification GTPase [Pseudohongiellaceae bacterium]|jgi:tRNA modification GTPase